MVAKKGKTMGSSNSTNTEETAGHDQAAQQLPARGSTLLQVLEKCSADIRLDDERVKRRNEVVTSLVRHEVMESLKRDPLFEKLFQEVIWTGSFYEGLKISDPDEYDVNVVLRLPGVPTKPNQGGLEPRVEVTTRDAPPGYLCINNLRAVLEHMETSRHSHWDIYKPMLGWCTADRGSLLPDKLHSWLEGLLARYLDVENIKHLLLQHGLGWRGMSKSGPAHTMRMWDEEQGCEVSIDLVPAIQFMPQAVPLPQPFKTLPNPPLPWFLVPKLAAGTTRRNYGDAWRVSCCLHEKRMIKEMGRLKPAIKLIKKMRDTQDWKNLHSYFIKTVALGETKGNRINVNDKLDKVFIELLRRLQWSIKNDKVLHYWDPRFNLLQRMSPDERFNIANRMDFILNKFSAYKSTDSPDLIVSYIFPRP